MVAKEADKETAGETKSLEAPAAPGNAPEQASQVIDGKPAAKAVLVGDSGVGKTSLLLRFSRAEFVTSKATIGVDLQAQTLSLPDGKSIKLQVWDTAGAEQFQSLTSSYFRRAHAVVLVYDVNNRNSFSSLGRWMMEVDRLAPAEVVKMVVGAKDDSHGGETAVSSEEAAAFASKHGALCERCSAQDGTNVQDMFKRCAVKIVRNGFDPDGKPPKAAVSLATSTTAPKRSKCC